MPSFDPRPLTEPVDRHAVREYAKNLRARGGTSAGQTVGMIIAIVAIAVFAVVFLTMLGTFVTVLVSSVARGGAGAIIRVLAPLLVFLVLGASLTVVIVRLFRSSRSERQYRLERFARANGMTFVPRLNAPALPGMIFGLGGSRYSFDLVRGDKPRFVEFANYRYTTGSGKNRTTHRWGYVAVKLDVPLPHIVLDALGNNGLFGSNLPLSFTRDQRLSLEGDFDKYFALYCPSGYERDALYLFTPDIMARFIDNAAALDVEIVDDWLFLYAKRDFSTTDPATWAWLFSVVSALLDKLAQWARWRDDRLRAEHAAFLAQQQAHGMTAPGTAPVDGAGSMPFTPPVDAFRPPPGVAAGGRRLRRGVPWAAIIVIGIFAVFWLLGPSGLLQLLFSR